MGFKKALLFLFVLSLSMPFLSGRLYAQCGGIMEPGFAFLTSSKGCAPFTVNIETLYLSSVPGTQYFINWGDGTAEEVYTQASPTGVMISHTYPNYSIDCGYDITIDASNACNPRGSVVPITTQVIVWTNDVVSVAPAVYRVCQGYAADVLFTDDSDWNCFPRATRENNAPRWIQWIYGTGSAVNRIPGVQVSGVAPGAYPYLDPAPFKNPMYPVLAPGQTSLQINVPVTGLPDIGKEFEITLKNWNQCNAYDDNILDGDPFNPVSGNLINGDNAPQTITARVVIVPSPQADYLTRLGSSGGPVQSIFCAGDNIYFDNETPPIGGASFQYTWRFFDNDTGAGSPLTTSSSTNPVFAYPTSGQKMIRLSVRDANAAGNCVSTVEKIITISPSLLAQINVTDLTNNPITPYFCQEPAAPLSNFDVRFTDASIGAITPTTEWRWEFYDENNVIFRREPSGGGFSSTFLGPFDQAYQNRGIYRVRLIIRDNVTACETIDEAEVRVYGKPVPVFTATTVCAGEETSFEENSTLVALTGEAITLREWDFDYDGVSFNNDPAFDNMTSFNRVLGAAGTYQVALRVTASQNSCSAILALPVEVAALPIADFSPDVTSGCSVLTVNFTNNGAFSQPGEIEKYTWEINEGAGFSLLGEQDPADPDFSDVFTHQFENISSSPKDYQIRLMSVSVYGCETISAPTTITVYPGISSGFISTNYSPFNDNCTPLTVNFTVDAQTQALNPSDYTWQVSDTNGLVSETSTGTTPVFNHEFLNGTQSIKDFFVTLVSTLPSGCYGDSTRTVRISPKPSSDFEIDTLLFDCEKMQLQFNAVQAGLTEYNWSVSENGTLVLASLGGSTLNYEVNRQGDSGIDILLQVGLQTRNLANCVSSVTTKGLTVPKTDGINAEFSAAPVNQVLPASTVTVSLQNPGPWNYMWEFGDGTTSSDPNVGSHTYSGYGTYTIRLTVSSHDCSAMQVQTIFIDPIPPMVDFEYFPPAGCAPLTVAFTNKSQYAEPDTYFWEFGQGQSTSQAINPTYTYYEAGTYSVSLTASNATGEIVSVTKQAIIEVYPLPVARFDIKPKVLFNTDGIMYTDNQSFNATKYTWDFGDGSTSELPEPEHTYSKEGIYSITLVATNEHECSDTTRMENVVTVRMGGQVLIPNAFSPGLGSGAAGDGQNDFFLPLTRGVVAFEMLVYNRWGELLFQSTDPEIGWDGSYNGKMCAQDVYVYKLTARYENGQEVVRMGDINLIR